MNFLKWGAIVAAVVLLLKGLSRAYETGGPNLASDGEAVVGTGWAAPLTKRRDVYAWVPPYGIARQ